MRSRLRYQFEAAALFSLALALAGCKPDAAVSKGEVIGRGTAPAQSAPAPVLQTAQAPAADAGAVSGTVLFSGKPPVQPLIDTSMDPACAFAGGGEFHAEQYAVTNGKLANVFVYVKSGPAAAMQAASSAGPSVLDQKGCRYVPHVIGVHQGGFVEFRNSDPTMHNIHTMPVVVGNETIDISQGPKGAPVSKRFDKPELMLPVRCNNHPWMNAFINVSPTPFFAVTGTDGKFTLRGLPPGDYVIAAVHEKLGEKTMSVHVAPNAAAKAEFSYAAK